VQAAFRAFFSSFLPLSFSSPLVKVPGDPARGYESETMTMAPARGARSGGSDRRGKCFLSLPFSLPSFPPFLLYYRHGEWLAVE